MIKMTPTGKQIELAQEEALKRLGAGLTALMRRTSVAIEGEFGVPLQIGVDAQFYFDQVTETPTAQQTEKGEKS